MQLCKQTIAEAVAKLLDDVTAADVAKLIEYPPNPELGDLSLPCFAFSKLLRKAPVRIADELQQQLKLDAVERISSAGGYLNFYLDKTHFADSILRDIRTAGAQYGSSSAGEGKTVVIDFSSPNIAKPFHIAHLRSTVIGHALYRIYSFQGYRCIGINHLGDWGTQFGKLIVAYRNWGSAEQVTQGGIDELLRLYVKFHAEVEQKPELEEEARAWFAAMEQGDTEALQLWQWFVEISLQEFKRIYELLGVQFDSFTGESFYNDKMGLVVEQLKAKGLLEEDAGASLVRLDDYQMPPALILKQDGSSLYHTRDIAAALYRQETYHFDKAIYVTDYAQNLHFAQWFQIVRMLGHEWADNLVHVAFGRVSMEGASLSTRKGNMLKLEAVLEQAIAKTKAIMEARNPDMDNMDEIARQVGVGAIVFHDLSSNRIKDIDFSWEHVLNFEGESGPYLQYTYARASSVVAKAGAAYSVHETPVNAEHLIDDKAYELIRQLSLFGEHVDWAMNKLEPSVISRYLIDLAQAFNRFYHACPILVDHAEVRAARLTLVDSFRSVMRIGLHLIGLDAPDKI
jgi:arginyl-tRNA synthetase